MMHRIVTNMPEPRDIFRRTLTQCMASNPDSIRWIVALMALYLHVGPFSRDVIAQIDSIMTGLEPLAIEPRAPADAYRPIREHSEPGILPIVRRTVMAPSRDAVDEKVTAAVGVDTRSITSSCYRVYLAEFRRKSRPTMGVLPGLACASILNTNSSCPSWLSRLIR